MGWLLMHYLHALPAVSYCGLGLIKRDIAKVALLAHCDRRKRSYFVVKDFYLFFFEALQVLWLHLKILSETGSCIKRNTSCSPSSSRAKIQ